MAMARNKDEDRSGESKADRFARLAQPRTTNVLRSIRILGNLSNTSNYEYTPAQVSKIFGAIREQLDIAESKFRAGARESMSKKFKL
jgi:hypothetical protein